MKLNAEILASDLSAKFQIEKFFCSVTQLRFSRPELWTDETSCLERGHLYVLSAVSMERLINCRENATVICVGNTLPMHFIPPCNCIWVKEDIHLHHVFNYVQKCYDYYDNWEMDMIRIEQSTASPHEILQCSAGMFRQAAVITLIDKEYNYLAQCKMDQNMDLPDNIKADFTNILGHMRTTQTSQHHKEPFFTTQGNIELLHIDIFDEDVFLANLSIAYKDHNPSAKDVVLAQFLAEHLKIVLKKQVPSVQSRTRILRELFVKLLKGDIITEEHFQKVLQTGTGCDYQCVKMKPSGHYRRVSGAYICSMIESTFKGSVSFQHDDAIVSFIDCTTKNDNDMVQEGELKEFIGMVSYAAGLSNRFNTLALAPFYYRQASIALSQGNLLGGTANYFHFNEYALSYMLSNALGEFPLQLLIPDGMKKLLEHDAISETSYIHTLRTYLNNNMSIVKTAEDLYMHRSRLLPRIKRINALLQVDLQNADKRLQIQMLLKIMEEKNSPT